MRLILLSGRPGTGKTAYGEWLVENLGYAHIDSDSLWDEWGSRLIVGTLDEAIATRNYARQLGEKVVIEWGFKVALLNSVRLLRTADFETWWFDGDESAARHGYMQRRGDSAPVMAAYQVQTSEINDAWPKLQKFYGDHIIRTVEQRPTYKTFDEIASIMFGLKSETSDQD